MYIEQMLFQVTIPATPLKSTKFLVGILINTNQNKSK